MARHALAGSSARRYLALALGAVVLALAGYLGYVLYPRFDLPAGAGAGLLLLAAGAGVASFFSPCAFPLLVTMLARPLVEQAEAQRGRPVRPPLRFPSALSSVRQACAASARCSASPSSASATSPPASGERAPILVDLTGQAFEIPRAPSANAPSRPDERGGDAFVAARAVPGGFMVALAGGVPLARASQRHGTRAGYAAAGVSLIETMAIMGPARTGIPVPHAASAPALGALERRGTALLALALAGAAIRFGYYLVTSAFSFLVLVGLEARSGHTRRSARRSPS